MRLNELVKMAFLAKSTDEKIEINNIISDNLDFNLHHVYQIEELNFVVSELDKDFDKSALYFYQANSDKGEGVSISDIEEYFRRSWVLDYIVKNICMIGNYNVFQNYFDFEPFLEYRIHHDLGHFYTKEELKDYLNNL